VASQLDHNPSILFELRGLSKDELQAELAKSPLGRALSSELTAKEIPLSVTILLYPTRKVPVTEKINQREFWLGTKRLPSNIEVADGLAYQLFWLKNRRLPCFWQKIILFSQ